MLLIRPVPGCQACRAIARRFLSSSFRSSNGQSSSSKVDPPSRGPYKILFCGSDEFSVASLRAVLYAKDTWQSIQVVTPPRQQVGRRGKKTYTPALLTFAEEHNLPWSPTPIAKRKDASSSSETSDPEPPDEDWLPEAFTTRSPDHLLLTASFGRIIPNSILNKFDPAHRLNVHPSLLPRWRGAAPVQWTIASGDKYTAVTVQRLQEKGRGIDGGDIVGVERDIEVPPRATFATLLPHLADIGGKVLVGVLRDMMAGKCRPMPQDREQVVRAPKIHKESARVDWAKQDAEHLDRLHRGIGHQRKLWTEVSGKTLQLVDPIAISTPPQEIGTGAEICPGMAFVDPTESSESIFITCAPPMTDGSINGDGHREVTWLQVGSIVPEFQAKMPAGTWFKGLPEEVISQGWVKLG